MKCHYIYYFSDDGSRCIPNTRLFSCIVWIVRCVPSIFCSLALSRYHIEYRQFFAHVLEENLAYQQFWVNYTIAACYALGPRKVYVNCLHFFTY